MEGHSGVGIAEIAILLIAGTDLPCHLFLAAPAAAKAFLNGGQRLGPDGIAADFRQALHQARHLGIAAGDVIEQALQIEDTRISMLGEVVLKNSRLAV